MWRNNTYEEFENVDETVFIVWYRVGDDGDYCCYGDYRYDNNFK